MQLLGILSNRGEVKYTLTLQVSVEHLIAKIYVSAGRIQSFQQLMAQEKEGRLPYITSPEVMYFILATGLEKTSNN